MSIDKVNDILNNNKEFSKEELDNLEKIHIVSGTSFKRYILLSTFR